MDKGSLNNQSNEPGEVELTLFVWVMKRVFFGASAALVLFTILHIASCT